MNRVNQRGGQTIILIMLVVLGSGSAHAQGERRTADEVLYNKVFRLVGSLQDLNPRKASRYLGYEISLAFPQYHIKSSISQLNGLPVSFTGICVGGIAANQRGKLKANVGLFYSNPSVPYSIDLWSASVTSNIYLLRLKNPRYHTIEPYAALGVSQHMNRFYGNYLDNSKIGNYSTTHEPLLGRMDDTMLVFGGGLEFQLENDEQKFIHLFSEFSFAKSLRTTSSNETFSETSALNSLLISLGVSFGVVK